MATCSDCRNSSNAIRKDEIKTKIVDTAQGMCVNIYLRIFKMLMVARFLLAKLHLEALVGKRSSKTVRKALIGLLTGPKAYD